MFDPRFNRDPEQLGSILVNSKNRSSSLWVFDPRFKQDDPRSKTISNYEDLVIIVCAAAFGVSSSKIQNNNVTSCYTRPVKISMLNVVVSSRRCLVQSIVPICYILEDF